MFSNLTIAFMVASVILAALSIYTTVQGKSLAGFLALVCLIFMFFTGFLRRDLTPDFSVWRIIEVPPALALLTWLAFEKIKRRAP